MSLLINKFVYWKLYLVCHSEEQRSLLLPVMINNICSSAEIIDFPLKNEKTFPLAAVETIRNTNEVPSVAIDQW